MYWAPAARSAEQSVFQRVGVAAILRMLLYYGGDVACHGSNSSTDAAALSQSSRRHG